MLLLKLRLEAEFNQAFKEWVLLISRDKLGRTAMHSMACGGSTGMLSVLREAGASITVREYHGRTVAHYAAMASQTELLGEQLSISEYLPLSISFPVS